MHSGYMNVHNLDYGQQSIRISKYHVTSLYPEKIEVWCAMPQRHTVDLVSLHTQLKLRSIQTLFVSFWPNKTEMWRRIFNRTVFIYKLCAAQ